MHKKNGEIFMRKNLNLSNSHICENDKSTQVYSLLSLHVDTSYLNTDVWKLESSQKGEAEASGLILRKVEIFNEVLHLRNYLFCAKFDPNAKSF